MKKISMYSFFGFFLLLLVKFGFGQLGYQLIQGRWHFYEDSKKESNEIIASSATAERSAANIDDKRSNKKGRWTEILHPYIDYIVGYHGDTCPSIGFYYDRMRGHQSLLQEQDFAKATLKWAILVIVGGCFAYSFAYNSKLLLSSR